MPGREVDLLFWPLELDQGCADVLFGCTRAFLFLAAHVVLDRANGGDAGGARIGGAGFGIDEFVRELAARSAGVVVQQRLEILLAAIGTAQPTGYFYRRWERLSDSNTGV